MRGSTEARAFEFTGYANDPGFLGKIESEPLDANDFNDAETKA